jgi:cob(I)alamin adenosyltransferase
MGITTKTGDRGKTSLLNGKRVSKDHAAIKACAQLDELCSFLGLARCHIRRADRKKLLEGLQKDLYLICAEVSAQKQAVGKLKRRIDGVYVKRLEDAIGDLEKGFRLKKCFILSGKNLASAVLDVARARCRSAEISIVTLKTKKWLPNAFIPIYLNRLSDLLFLLSRASTRSS